MATPDSNRDLEALIAQTERNRVQVQKASEKLENLRAAIESAREAHDRVKGAANKRPRGKR